ncbi:hypothetical protein HYV88_00605 [Candidatus Woesearchaeota archaeon]|nr:hypothetical protein [Candidatus Woesearchaeota archaeon]
MSKSLKLFLIIFLIVIFNSLLVLATKDPIVNISLTKTEYVQKDKLIGDIVLTFTDEVEDKELEIRFGQNSDITPLSQILTILGENYETTPGKKELVPLQQPDDSITFPPLVQELGISVPKNAEDITAVGNIGGWESLGSVPKFPYLDVAGDGLIEWSYLGDLLGWSNIINSNDLGSEAGFVDIQNKDVLVCQKITLTSKVKAVNITANFKEVSSGAKVKARLLTMPDNSKKSFGSSDCELKKDSYQTNPYGNCVITFDEIPKVRQGDYLVCIFPEVSEPTTTTTTPTTITFFKIAKDNRQTQKSYICTHKPEGYSECNTNNNYNHIIKVSLPIYNGSLDSSSIPFSEGITEANLNKSIKNYLSSSACQDDDTRCIVPIEVGSQTPGRLFFNGFSIKIRRQGIAEEALMQKLRSLSDTITKIDSKSLSNNEVKVSIPIRSFYNFTTPQVTTLQTIPLEVRYGSSRAVELIEISPSLLTGKKEVNTTISETLDLLDSYSNTETKDLLNKVNINIDSLKTQFLAIRTRLNTIESNSTKTQVEKDREKLTILSEVENLKKSVPRYFYLGDKAFNLPSIPPSQTDISSSILGNQASDNIKEYILSLQRSISVSSNAKAFSLKTFGNQSHDYTMITRVVAGAPSDAFIVDFIPKAIAQSSVDLVLDQSIEILESDPIIKKQLSSGSGTFSYMAKGNIIDQITDINTLVVSLANAPSGTPTRSASYTNVECGNNICDVPLEDEKVCPEDCKPKRNWTLIIIALAVFVLGVFYINFYKGPGNIQKFLTQVKERLFHVESDKANLINYIKRAAKHKSKTEIVNILFSKGWTREQIEEAFKEALKK